ncbi:MAG: carbohydrate ABC transporter permease [Gaiellaceae bacterium]
MSRAPEVSRRAGTRLGLWLNRGYAGRRRRTGILLVLPALVVMLAVLGYPIASSVVLSLQRIQPGGGRFVGTFVGLDNYLNMGSDPAFLTALVNSIYFTAVEVVVVVVAGLGIALLLNHPLGRSGFFRVILLIPWALAPVANAVIWKWIYNANYGILNVVLHQLGIIDQYVVWLGDQQLALNALLVADIWKSIPFMALLLLAGLQNVPPILYRAARLDGAGAWQTFRFVTLPQMRTTILICVVLQSIWALKVFDLIYVLTKGGPADGTVLLNFLSYRQTFDFGYFGYGAALADVLFLMMFALALVYLRVFRPSTSQQVAA